MKLAFTGISGSGKDFLVNHLIEEERFTRVSFSDQLKKLAKLIYPWMETDYEPIIKETPLNITIPETGEFISHTPREIWLMLNDLRKVENKLFLRMLQDEISNIDSKNIVISDVRPQLEWDWCKKEGFTTIYVEPMKKIYEPNDFDKQVLNYKDEADFVFENTFDGLDKFINFYKTNLHKG
jgi:dephospho-CoA kinase